jgi:hypothetical protein
MRKKIEVKDKNEEEDKNKEEEKKMLNKINIKKREDDIYTKEQTNLQFEIPEFLRSANNDQFLQMFMRMRQRHFTDGAVNINIQKDDIADQNLELYDNKGINIELPILNENLASNVEYYIESVNRDKFYKLPKRTALKLDLDTEKEKQKEKVKEKKIQRDKNEMKRLTEDEIFYLFDIQLTDRINKTASKISLLFLFTEGLLAGKNYLISM